MLFRFVVAMGIERFPLAPGLYPEVRELVRGLDPLVELVRKYGVEYRVSRTTEPGDIIYEDDFQVATR